MSAASTAAPIAAPGAAAASIASTEAVEWPQDARVSLELHRVPLTRLLSLLSAQSGVRFRLATIPDVEVSVSLQNAPLQQAVRDLLALNGFDLRPGPDAFWLVAAPPVAAPLSYEPSPRLGASAANSASSPSVAGAAGKGKSTEMWRWWASAQAPPPRWMIPVGAEQIAYDGEPRASGVPGLAPFGVRVRLQPEPPLLSRWKGGVQKFQAAVPGALPSPGLSGLSGSAGASSPSAAGRGVRWCARWPVFLRSVPARCLLVIESERPANFYINGARLLHAWSGRRTLEVSGSLGLGSNLLALEWPELKPAPASTSAASASVEAAPLVRYEWLVAQ